MPDYTQILRELDADRFLTILDASPRRTKDDLFRRYGIKAPKTKGFTKPGAKTEACSRMLFETIQVETDEEASELMLRSYFIGRRELLIAACDYVGVEHEDGLTESDDVDKLATLKGAELKKCIKALEKSADRDDVVLYLKFMGNAAAA